MQHTKNKMVSSASKRGRRAGGGVGGSAPLALYQRLKVHILDNINSGEWPAGYKLPSEHQLVEQFGMSRMTVNRALRELVAQGRIVRAAGIGSFVAEEKPQSTLFEIANLQDDIRRRGHVYRYNLLALERVPASAEIAVAFELRVGDPVFYVRCLHYGNDEPVQLEERYVNPAMVPDFMEQDFTQISPSDYLVRSAAYDEMEHLVDAVLPDATQAKLLKITKNYPCLLLSRRTWNQGQAVTVVSLLYPSARHRLGSRFHKDHHAG